MHMVVDRPVGGKCAHSTPTSTLWCHRDTHEVRHGKGHRPEP